MNTLFNLVFGKLFSLVTFGLNFAESIHTDQFLGNFATNYRANTSVADFVASPFKVKRPADKYVTYTKAWLRNYDTRISGREEGQEIQYETSSATYTCEQHEVSKFVSYRALRNTDKPINLKTNAVKHMTDAMAIAREYRISQIAGNASVITQTSVPTVKWDIAATGIPIEDIKDAMGTIWTNTGGKQANKIIMTYDTALKLTKTDNFKDYFKYDNSKNMYDPLDALRNLGLEPMLCNMFAGSAYEGTASDPTIESIWSDKCLVFYSEPTPTLESRTLMYSPYTLKDQVTVDTQKERRGIKYYQEDEIDELLVDATCGYLFTDCITD